MTSGFGYVSEATDEEAIRARKLWLCSVTCGALIDTVSTKAYFNAIIMVYLSVDLLVMVL